jgi:hypothetical protein
VTTPSKKIPGDDGVGIARPIAVFLVFVILGPPIGSLILLVGAMIATLAAPGPWPFRGGAGEFEAMVALFFVFSYLVGGLQALAVAFVALISHVLRWPALASFLAVAAAGFVAGVVALVAIGATAPTPTRGYGTLLFFLAIHVGAGIGCWLIAQALLWAFPRRQPSP